MKTVTIITTDLLTGEQTTSTQEYEPGFIADDGKMFKPRKSEFTYYWDAGGNAITDELQ